MAAKFDKEQIDKLLASCTDKADIFGEDGLLKTLVKSVLERALEGEMREHKNRGAKLQFSPCFCNYLP